MTDDHDDATPAAVGPWLQVQGSRHFLDWLAEMRVRLASSMFETDPLRGSGLL